MSETKISIRAGGLEIEYTGESTFLASGLLNLIRDVAELKTLFAVSHSPNQSPSAEPHPPSNNGQSTSRSTHTIATLLNVNTGPELIIAAAAHITFTQGKDKFTRKDLLAEMKTAPGFFNQTHSSNLSKNLISLTGQDKLRRVSTDTYALSNKTKVEIEAKLAQTS
jgi:hypothetical protein